MALLVLVSLMWASVWPAPWSLKLYLLAQMLSVSPLWFVALVWGDRGWPYRVTYCICTAVVLWTITGILREALWTRERRARLVAIAGILALVMTRIAYVGWDGRNNWIVLSEGFLLVLAGILMGFLAAYLQEKWIPMILALLWFSQGLFDFGWLLHDWAAVNWIVPPVTGAVGFTALGFRLRAMALQQRRIQAQLA